MHEVYGSQAKRSFAGMARRRDHLAMTSSPSLLVLIVAHDRRADIRRRAATRRLVRPDARPRRGPVPM
jgi:hypothetical protein